jgi:predicted HTH transcriptional regulator
LYYWKASLFLHQEKLSIKLFDVPEQRVLENLADVTLMTLAALIEHNGLTLKGLTQVLNDDEDNVRRRIEELVPHGIVFSFDEGERAGWHVESFWTRAVENYLLKRQFLFKGHQL